MKRMLQGDALTVLRTLPDESVQCCVTSPPYWGLRDYGTATWDGGDAECDHSERRWDGPKQTQGAMSGHAAARDRLDRRSCLCGATRIDSQLGLEPTPEEYVANMVEVFREVRRVLRSDGTLWLNMGDSYASNPASGGERIARPTDRSPGAHQRTPRAEYQRPSGLKPKDLVGIPWRVAFALQSDGWYLRSDIIWSKPNPMPESVTDRPTKAHEYLFLLSKSARYYYDADAIREPHMGGSGWARSHAACPTPNGMGNGEMAQHTRMGDNPAGRNKRTVWTIATAPYPEAHFATYPEALVEPCILAGTKPGDTVLDPFAGSGTTLAVAKRLDREGVGIELNPAYAKLAEKRIAKSARQIALFEVTA